MIEDLENIALIPDELVFTNSTIVLETREAIDRKEVETAVGVRGVPGKVSLGRNRKRVTWTPTEDATAGWHEFVVDALVSDSGDLVSRGGRVRFGLVRSAAQIPRNVAVESMVRLRVERAGVTRLNPFANWQRGKYVEIMKASDRRTGAPVRLAFDEEGNRVDADQVLKDILTARVVRLGKMGEALGRRIRDASSEERISVAIWARTHEEIEPDDKSPDETMDADQVRRLFSRRAEIVREATARLIDELAGENVETEPDELAPVVYVKLTKDAIRRLQRSEQVSAIFYYDPRGFDDLDDSLAIANSDDVHALGARGRGVRVAVWERGPDVTTDLDIEDSFETPGAMSSHSRLVHGVIKNTEPNEPHGHAPDCDLYSANSYDLAALRWAVQDELCTVINQSFHRDDEQTSDSLSFDDIYKDWLILRAPYPTIVQAAGNGTTTEYVNHKGHNSIAVANHDDTAAGLSSSSVFRNPASPHSDRELPEISANGTGVAAVDLVDSGTSFASPAIAGVAALLQGEDAVLRSWPEGCRAILLAGATRNITNSTWWQDVSGGTDAGDGSGAVNALESYRIVNNRRSLNAAASRRGWDVGTLNDDDFDRTGYSKFTYKVAVPGWRFGPTHVKAALAWDSKVKEVSIFGITFPVSSRLEQDLDLKIFNSAGILVAHSQSWDNSYEIAEFDASRGEEYTIKIRRWSGTGWTWYGIAWTVTGGLLDFIQVATHTFEAEPTFS
jgi:Subtilase family